MSHSSLSIIIPCYNGASSVEKLKDSLGTLEPQPEIIFVDDGSTDHTAETIQKYFPDSIYIYQENAGVATARNSGAAQATGTYLLFLDCDDILCPDTLWARVKDAQSNNLDVQTSSWRMEIRSGDSVTLEPCRNMNLPDDIVASLLHGNWWGPPHAYLIKKSAYDSINGSDTSLVNAQDFDVWLRLAIAEKKWGAFKELTGHYVRNLGGQSLARGPRNQYWSDTEKVLNKAISLLETKEAFTDNRKIAIAHRLHLVARNVYSIELNWYDRIISRILEIDPKFSPEGNHFYKSAVRFLGFRKAEKLARFKRMLWPTTMKPT